MPEVAFFFWKKKKKDNFAPAFNLVFISFQLKRRSKKEIEKIASEIPFLHSLMHC